MFAAKTLAMFIVATAVPLAAASPTNDTAIQGIDFWGQFCDDTGCSRNCGRSVRISNPGCLNEPGRRSIRFHGANVGKGDYALVVSPSGSCPCQSSCSSVPHGTRCWSISNYRNARSFRFISGHCNRNNC
ncbi:hypothetical protein GQX73_g5362 [Xylaria multiplex]|uniref:Uncharacterized protein n=1 Tax=Xylaria multiplex TaxID=323545 RepID=A0A7C8ISS8_9PEZI|nr:hypothetical protein GQX73_g5362 [Xylaria multiplex]